MAKMSEEFAVITQSLVHVTVSSSVNSFGSERRFQKDLTIAELKSKLELLTGSSAGSMKLELYNAENKLLCSFDNDNALLGSYPVEDGMRLHVVDPTLRSGEFEDVSRVEKFELSQDEYSKRTDTVKAFKEKNKLGRFREIDPEEQKRLDEEKARNEEVEKAKAESIKVGDRCEVSVSGQLAKRGSVKYVGLTEFQTGYWVGIQFDEPTGKNDGSVKGKRYFECPPKYGSFVKPASVTTGDFPEEDLMLSDDEM